jgi:drug/metabolite transporter (DMT)-like permease
MMQEKRGLSSVDIAILGAAMVWGGSYLASRELTHFASLWGMMALRFIIAAVILLVIRAFKPVKFSKIEILSSLGIAVTLATVMTVETTGVYLTSATNSGLIISLSILFTPLIEGLVSKFWMPRMFYVSALGAVLGVAILISGNGFTEPNLGDLLMIVAAVLRAVHTVSQSFFTHGKFTRGKTVDTTNVTIMSLFITGVFFLILDPAGTINAALTYGVREWILMGTLVLFSTVYGFIVMLWAIRKTSASRVALLQGTEPVWAVIIAVLLGGELMSAVGWLGAAVIIAACYWGLGIENRARETRLLKKSAK